MFLRDSCGRGHEYDITVEVGERLPEGLRGTEICVIEERLEIQPEV